MNTLEQMKNSGAAPEWMSPEGFKTLQNGYLNPGETPRDMYNRVAEGAANRLKRPDLKQKFFDIIWKNWLCLATPVAANMNNARGLPISCFSIHPGDSLHSIMNKAHELAMMSKYGGGVGIYLGDLRGRGSVVQGTGGISDGVISWAKIYEATVNSVSQGFTRRGSAAGYLQIQHVDVDEFINMRRPTGDTNRRCLNLHHGLCLDDEFMNSLLSGNADNRHKWEALLAARFETGEPYLFFSDNVNSQRPEAFVKNNLKISTSNICCLSGDTEVLTKNGPTRIDSLVGRDVEIWDGRDWVKNNSFELRGFDDLIRIHLKDGSFVDSNPSHRWFVANNYKDIGQNTYKEILTKDLQPGQFLEYHCLESHGTLEEPGAYLKGFLIGDGTQNEGKPYLRLHSVKYACEPKLIENALQISAENGISRTEYQPGFSREYDYTANGQALGKQIFKNMEGLFVRKHELLPWASEYKYKLPDRVFNYTKETKLELLAGILDADGTVSKSCSIQISSVHADFLTSLQKLLKTLGVSSNIEFCVKAGSEHLKSQLSRLTISSFDGYYLLQQMDCKRLRYSGRAPNRKLTGWRKIAKIEKLDGVHPVYCPSVPTTGKFALANGLMTGNSEIFLPTDPEHSFVCCLSSLNLARWDEWKDTDVVELSIYFLDAVIEEFIQKAKHIAGFEDSVRFAEKSRSLGLGVLGWHTLLQERMIPFDSFDAMMLNSLIFKTIRTKADKATAQLAKEYGEPLWCQGLGRRNATTMAVAPTVSNSLISGGLSAGIEPIAANLYVQNSAKGAFVRKNKTLEKFLEQKGLNTEETWYQINKDAGSILNVKGLTQDEKEVFLTAKEINQFALIRQAASRQKWIDQGQSLNLFFGVNSDPKYVHSVHLEAWKLGLKSLYYCRTESVLRGDLASRSADECKACEG